MHSFYLLCGECTITLEDVALRLELHVDDNAPINVNRVFELATLCYDLLGLSLEDSEDTFTTLKFSWL